MTSLFLPHLAAANKEQWYINCGKCQFSSRQEYKNQFCRCPVCGLIPIKKIEDDEVSS